ncbi:2'-5' RNA ligase family protein [Ruminococcaceae bacterium OttesenSCG-928-L11]|nr:2'-5' RNA ligase family protein [Ruminococcaceae bacterium OttesenSCG-928-L11]
MGSLVTIRVPDEFAERVKTFCKQRQYTPGDMTVTLIEPSLLESISGIEQKLRSFCLAQKDFNVVIGGPSCYNNQLLYLNVLPGYIQMTRNALLDYLKIPARDKAYRPHLTFMRSLPGRELDLNRMLTEAQQHFTTPFSFTASQLELYTQQHSNAPFKPFCSVEFTGR